MDVKINYSDVLEAETRDQINFIREEFDMLFKNKKIFTKKDQILAAELLNHLSKLIDTPTCLDFLSKTLEDLEMNFGGLF